MNIDYEAIGLEEIVVVDGIHEIVVGATPSGIFCASGTVVSVNLKPRTFWRTYTHAPSGYEISPDGAIMLRDLKLVAEQCEVPSFRYLKLD